MFTVLLPIREGLRVGRFDHAPKNGTRLLEDYVEIRDGNRSAWVQVKHQDTIAPALMRGDGCRALPGKGRGTLCVFPLKNQQGVIRRYRRGGLVGKVLWEDYLLDNRPKREFDLHRSLEQDGLPVAPLLGVMWEQRGARYRGAIATQQIDSPNLLEWLGTVPEDTASVLRECGQMIRRFHDAGVAHADLQIKNILIRPDGPVLIDFDNARRHHALSMMQRQRNLLRLRRSFERHNLGSHFDDVLTGYGSIVFPGWLDAAYRLRGRFSGVFAPEKQGSGTKHG